MAGKSKAAPKKRNVLRDMAVWASILMILFITAVPYLHLIDRSGAGMASIRDWFYVAVYFYLTIETFETANRQSNDMASFIADNVLALAGFIWGIVEFVLWRTTWTYDQWQLMFQSTLALGFDFAFGIILALRIAFAGKEREETFAQ